MLGMLGWPECLPTTTRSGSKLPSKSSLAWADERRRKQKRKRNAKRMMATPPTAPPAMAPMWEVETFVEAASAGAVIVEPGGRTVVTEMTTVDVWPWEFVDLGRVLDVKTGDRGGCLQDGLWDDGGEGCGEG